MNNFAVSNIALSPYDHEHELARLPEFGLTGLEVAPSRIWKDTWHGLSASQVEAYRKQVEKAGLRVVGLHSLFFDQPDLGLFRDAETRARTLDFLVHLSALCRDLGGRTLIYGSAPARRRGDLSLDAAFHETASFFQELCERIKGHGTCYCFEPLGSEEADFINSAFDALKVVEAVDDPALRIQLDAKALVQNDEVDSATFKAVASYLVHFHANDPGLGVLGETGAVDHAAMGRMLSEVGYDGFVSIEQRMLSEDNPLADVERSAKLLHAHYGGGA
jgi:sugar phosphate isomerase/epimerase